VRRRPALAAGARSLGLLAAVVALASPITALADSAAGAPRASLATPTVRPIAATPAAPANAALGDPLESAECQRALAALNAEEAVVAESSRASGGVTANDRRLIDARLAPMRRQAARACLARADPATLSSGRLVRPTPVATQPLAIAPASSPALTAATARAAPLAAPTAPAEKPYAITACDAGGCWANDGSRLHRVGPNLWGPRGVCTVQGALVQCP
jgi:hypothetical protein